MDSAVRLLIDTGTGYVLQIRKIEYSYFGGASDSMTQAAGVPMCQLPEVRIATNAGWVFQKNQPGRCTARR
jgi:hypothetical protein